MKSKESKFSFRFSSSRKRTGLAGAGQEPSSERERDCKRHKKVHTSRQCVAESFCRLNSCRRIKHAVPRISNEILDKGVRWMPRLKKAMKDAVWRRYASGRCPATFDPEISEWDNPIKQTLMTQCVKALWSRPREVKHLSTVRKREQ